MKHLKLFQTEVQYESFKGSLDFVLPNVSYCKDGKLFYNAMEHVLVYNMVDLGLPSGLKWADRNVGASSPEDGGLYFSWGETVGYTADQVINGEKVFSQSDYYANGGGSTNKYDIGKLTRLEASDDAATVNMGSDWRMPTADEMQELIDNTTRTYIDLQGNEFSVSEVQSGAIAEYNFKGVRFTGPNGNSIFIPAAGECFNDTFAYANHSCCMINSNCSDKWELYYLYFNYYGAINLECDSHYMGYSVRGVHA